MLIHEPLSFFIATSLTNGRGYKSWVVGVGVGEELIMIINMNIINISYI